MDHVIIILFFVTPGSINYIYIYIYIYICIITTKRLVKLQLKHFEISYKCQYHLVRNQYETSFVSMQHIYNPPLNM
jgi:hypothetical protein